MRFSPTDRFIISSEVLSQQVNGETVLLDLEGESYFGLNEVGTRVWQLLQAGESMQRLVDLLSAEFDASTDQIEMDVHDLLKKLNEAGLVKDSNE